VVGQTPSKRAVLQHRCGRPRSGGRA
jgi:hypothetical protein